MALLAVLGRIGRLTATIKGFERMIVLFVVIGVVFGLTVGADIYLGRHPLRKADKKAEKLRYKGW